MSDAWRKSSYSGSEANCVEVGNAAGLVKVRDTKDRQGPPCRQHRRLAPVCGVKGQN